NLERYSIATTLDSKISKVFSAGIMLRLTQERAFNNTQSDLPTMASTIPYQPFSDKNDVTGFASVASGTFEPNPDYDPDKLNPSAPFNFVGGNANLLW